MKELEKKNKETFQTRIASDNANQSKRELLIWQLNANVHVKLKPEEDDKLLIADLMEKLEEVLKKIIATCNTNAKRIQVTTDHTALEELVYQYPVMFNPKFKGGNLRISPVKFRFGKDVNTAYPLAVKMGSFAFKKRQILQKWVDEAPEAGIIEYSSSTWRNTIWN